MDSVETVAGGGEQIYRIVLATDGAPARSRLFVQWLKSEDQASWRIDRSIEIADVAKAGLFVADYHAEVDADGLSVFIDTSDASGAPGTSYELFVTAPDDYRFGPASN